jgi:hypothetical protein
MTLAGQRNFPPRTNGTVMIRVGHRQAAQEMLFKQNHINNASELRTNLDGSPFETSIQGAPHSNE